MHSSLEIEQPGSAPFADRTPASLRSLSMAAAPQALIWILVATTGGTLVATGALAGLSFDWPSIRLPLLAVLALAPLIWLYRVRRPDVRLAVALESVAQLVAFTALAELLSYVVASAEFPLQDAAFRRIDLALGLDWHAYLAFVNARPWFARALSFAYQSLEPQTIIVLLALCFTGRLATCRTFVLAFIFAGLITIFVSWGLPALGMYPDLNPDMARDFPHVEVVGGLAYVGIIEGLRNGSLRILSLANAQGIICCPSLHAALAVLFSIALWQLHWLRWLALGLNALLIASTPIIGGHYFIDVIAGVALSVVCWQMARLTTSRFTMTLNARLSADHQRQ